MIGPNGNFGDVYITQNQWVSEWEKAPIEISQSILEELAKRGIKLNEKANAIINDVMENKLNYLRNLAEDYAATD